MRSTLAISALLVATVAGCECQRSAPKASGPDLVVAKGKQSVEVLLAGDTMLGRGISKNIKRFGKGDPSWVLAPIADRLQQADVMWLNLECVHSDSDAGKADKKWLLRAPESHLDALRTAGVDIVSLSNNHTHDFHQQGVTATMQALSERNVLYSGIRAAQSERVQRPVIIQAGDTTLAFLAYNSRSYGTEIEGWPRAWWYSRADAIAGIRAAKKVADAVIVSVHWGWEYQMRPRPKEVAEAEALAAAGADVIVGHHPHVPGPVREIGDTLVAYSLGNFVFDMRAKYKHTRTRRGFLLSLTYSGGRRTGHELVPITADKRYRPRVAPKLDVDSWRRPPPATAYRLSDHMHDAKVERHRGEQIKRCGRWRKKQPRGPKHQYLWWLRPRWRCPNEKRVPWQTVAATGERSRGVYREGIWAHPHSGGPLVMTFPKVPLGSRLVGHAGVPDHGFVLAKKAPPIRVRVLVAGESAQGIPAVDQTFEIPHQPGWASLSVDTSALAGRTVDLRVEVSSDSGRRREFVYDLWVE
jgi:hypothetical protein